MTVEWIFETEDDGFLTGRVGREGTAIVAEWPGLGTYRSDRSQRFAAEPDAPMDELRKLRSAVASLDRWLEGSLTLHGSAVKLERGVVAFLGSSGAGKSTTAAAFVRDGASFVADDLFGVDFVGGRPVVIGGEEDHWLDRASRDVLGFGGDEAVKISVAPRERAHQGPLVMMVELVVDATTSELDLREMRGRHVMEALARAAVNVPGDPKRDALHFERLTALSQVPVVRVQRAASWQSGGLDQLVGRLRARIEREP